MNSNEQDINETLSEEELNDDNDTDLSSYSLLCEHVSEMDIYDMEEQIKQYIDEYVQHTILSLSSPTYYSDLDKEITGTLFEEWVSAGICEDHHYEDILEMVTTLRVEYFEMNEMPLREEPTQHTVSMPKHDIHSKLTNIQNVHQAKQRTTEWYETRYNLLTASNLWKVFGSPAQYNSLIFEKCKPLEIREHHTSSISVDNNNSLQHGIRYEPLSIMYYEYINQTKITDVGCILHEKYNYIGASPDGIVMDPASSLYGRMIEIKNIVNREITGVPMEAYWIQTQLQMEVCDLDECDFIETRFIQYDELPEDTMGKPSGIILYFLPKIAIGNFDSELTSEYVYLPLAISPTSTEADEWIQTQIKQREKHVLYKKTYWVLDEYSCVLVRRNRAWFDVALPKIEEAWTTILKERTSGYEHRTATARTNHLLEKGAGSILSHAFTQDGKKKKEQTEVVCSDNNTTHYIRNIPITNTICLVKLGGNQGSP